MVRWNWRGVLALSAALAIWGCKDRDAASEAQAKSAEPESAKPSEVSPRRGGYVVLPSNEPVVLNPLLQATFDRATPLVFEGLLGRDARLEPVPRLAESWSLSPDGKEIRFQLRKGVKWHDGKPFTSADVVYTVEQIRTAKLPTAWRGYLGPIEAVAAPDEHTVVVTYSEPYGPALASWTMGIVPRHVFEDEPDFAAAALETGPVGTGPFKVGRLDPGRSMILDANEDYWMGRPYLDRVELVFGIPNGAELDALKAGRLDFAEVGQPEEWSGEILTPEFRERYETTTTDENSLALIAWNGLKKPYSDRRVRLALTHSIDRARIIEDVLKGAGRRLSGPFYPRMWGGDPDIAPWPFDLEKAALLLDAAGHKERNGKRFTVELIALDTRRGPVFEQMMAIWRNDLATLGVDLRVEYLPASDFVGKLLLHEFDAAVFNWVPDIADPDPFVMLHSSQIGEGANYAGYSNQDVDRLLEAGRRSVDREERKKLYRQLHTHLHDDVPYTYLYAPTAHYAWSRRVHAVNPIDISSLDRFPGVARWWVDQ